MKAKFSWLLISVLSVGLLVLTVSYLCYRRETYPGVTIIPVPLDRVPVLVLTSFRAHHPSATVAGAEGYRFKGQFVQYKVLGVLTNGEAVAASYTPSGTQTSSGAGDQPQTGPDYSPVR